MKDSDIYAAGGAAAKLWVSGATIKQWEAVVSPLDGEIYRRKSAAGSGATDPADDITNYIAASYRRIASLVPPAATPPSGGTSTVTMEAHGIKPVGLAIGAGVRTQIVAATGRGRARFAGFCLTQASSINLTARFEIIIDGRTVLDFTGVATGVTSPVWVLIGGVIPSTLVPVLDSIPFRRSFEFYVTPATAVTTAFKSLYAFEWES